MKLLLLFLLSACVFAQQKPLSQQIADSFIARHPDSILVGNNKTARWDYEQGLMLKALERVWQRTGDGRYFTYILNDLNQFVQPDGSIRTYKADEVNSDNVTTGGALLLMAQQSLPGNEKFRKAADSLRHQLAIQPRTKAGGFWHKNRYPNQMWLDGLYMIEPFYAEYSMLFNQPANFDDIANQFTLIEQNLTDPKTGLLYHGYDESRQQQWANPKTGQSLNFWGRAMGWYVMALVDVLDYFPVNHPQRATLIHYLQRLAPILVRYQDPKTGCWWQIVDQGGRSGNYVEASASGMYVYALAKGVRMGYLPQALLVPAQKGYAGMLKQFVETEANGQLSLNGTVSVGGLGGIGTPDRPYRDGAYAYYLSEPLRKNDFKGVGPFILASTELEIAAELGVGRGKTVAVDNYFNNEYRTGLTGQPESFHYTWADRMHSGFWGWGTIFREWGAATTTLKTGPTAASLKGVDVYILVDPDSPKETAKPNYMGETDIRAITDWVKAGGTLVLLANDTANCDIPHINQLARQFGIQFTAKNRNMVQGTHWEQGRITIPHPNPVFLTTRQVYIKELSPLALTAPAKPLVTDSGDVIMATARLGKGRVFAVGDPWLYNEYTDGRRIPAEYANFQAAKELAHWLLR